MAPEDDEEEPVRRTPIVPSAIGVATEEDWRRDRSLPAPSLPEPAEGPVSRRESGGPLDDAPVPNEEYGAAVGLRRERLKPPPGETESDAEP